MAVDITVRHMETPESVSRYARTKSEDLMAAFPRVEHIHVIIDKEKREHVVEVVVQAKNHVRLDAKDSDENLRAAIDSAMEKTERQLRKSREKVQEKRAKPAPAPSAEEEAEM